MSDISCRCFFFNRTTTTEIYTLSLHDALPIFFNLIWSQVSGPVSMSATFANAASPATQVSFQEDRKSTRLNSSHLGISYAVFCLKKKITPINRLTSRL